MTEKEKMRKEIETMNTNIPDVSLDDIIGQEKAKAALSELKPFRDPAYDCLYADDEDDNNSNTGVLLHGPPGTVSRDDSFVHSVLPFCCVLTLHLPPSLNFRGRLCLPRL